MPLVGAPPLSPVSAAPAGTPGTVTLVEPGFVHTFTPHGPADSSGPA